MHIAHKHGERHKLNNVPIDYQVVDNDLYLKTVICYIIKNPTQAGLQYTPYDYPWSSGALYMRNGLTSTDCCWTAPGWMNAGSFDNVSGFSYRQKRSLVKTNETISKDVMMTGKLIFPGEYVAYELVNAIYRTPKSFQYFMGSSKDSDIEAKGGAISRLSIPDNEMRQNKEAVCKELFGVQTVRTLSTEQRLYLLRTLKRRYDSSPKQLSRMCGLKYEEIKGLI